MKLSKFALALTSALWLQTIAFANEDTDAIRASFYRDLDRNATASIAASGRADAYPPNGIYLLDQPDQLLASFERTLALELDSPRKLAWGEPGVEAHRCLDNSGKHYQCAF